MNSERIRRRQSLGGCGRQQGVVLFVALVFLVMLTVIGISLFGTTTGEEKMARNYRDYNLAFQAAESALRDAEIRITGYWVYGVNPSGTPLPLEPLVFTANCTNGLCNQAATQPVYTTYSMTAAPSVGLGDCPGSCDGKGNGTGTGSPTIASPALTASQPRYLIEAVPWSPPGSSLSDAGGGGTAYRITARGAGRAATTQVLLQEVFVPY